MAIFHVNFGLRGSDSLEDQRFTENLAKKYGVSFFCHNYRGLEDRHKGKSIQEWARDVRYSLLNRYHSNFDLFAVGHHLDDHAENLIFRAVRGVNFEQLSGMKCLHEKTWRPLLKVSKKDLLQYSAANGLEFRKDKSNDSNSYSRNRIRNLVLPELEKIFPDAQNKISSLASEIDQISNFLEEYLEGFLRGFSTSLPLGEVYTLPQVLRKRAIRQWIKKGRTHASAEPSNSFIEEICREFEKTRKIDGYPKNRSWNLPGAGTIQLKNGMIEVLASSSPILSLRHQQYLKPLNKWGFRGLIEGQGSCRIKIPSPDKLNASIVSNSKSSVEVDLYKPRPNELVPIISGARFRTKDLWVRLGLPLSSRNQFTIVKVECQAVFFFDGTRIMRPKNIFQDRVEKLPISLQFS